MLTNILRNYIDAAFSSLWIETCEPEEAIQSPRTWASGRCPDAARPSIYCYTQASRRNIRRNDPPSAAVA